MLIKKLYVYILFLFFVAYSTCVYSYPSNSIYNLELELIDKDSKNFQIGELSGKVQVFSMIYTNCKTICPIIVSNMKAIEKLIIKAKLNNHVHFSLVSLDPDRDSVDILKKYFNVKKLDEKTWNLYKTVNKNDALKLALTLGIKYKKEKNNEYTHSNLIIVLDKDGVIKLHHQGLDKNFDNVLKLIESLVQ